MLVLVLVLVERVLRGELLEVSARNRALKLAVLVLVDVGEKLVVWMRVGQLVLQTLLSGGYIGEDSVVEI